MNSVRGGIVVALFGALVVTTAALTGTEKPLDTKEAGLKVLSGSMVDRYPDGGLVWTVVVQVTDGGKEVRTLSQPDFVRQRPDGGTCLQRLPDGGTRNPGPWVRFPADAGVGAGCERVAQSVLGLPGAPDLESETSLVQKIPREVPGGK